VREAVPHRRDRIGAAPVRVEPHLGQRERVDHRGGVARDREDPRPHPEFGVNGAVQVVVRDVLVLVWPEAVRVRVRREDVETPVAFRRLEVGMLAYLMEIS
jgi:hypothetical protein